MSTNVEEWIPLFLTMHRPTTDPWQLAQSHRYVEALAAYDAELASENEQSAPRVANRATVLLCLCRWQEAFEGFVRANEIKSRKTKGLQPYLTKMATVLWLMGRRHDAVETLTRAVDSVASGEISYTDSAGGVSQGLLLWYAGITTSDSAGRKHALAYLSRLAEERRIQHWPGPLALYALGRMRLEQTMELMAGNSNDVGKAEVLKRRRLCQTLFYAAVTRRHQGDHAGCAHGMRQCCALENPLLEEEWYLARAEAGVSAT